MVSGQANQQIDGLVVSKLMGGQMNEQQMQQMMMQQQMQMGANQNQGFCGQCLGFIPCLSCLNSTPKQQVSLENYPRDKACGCFPRGTICCPADGGICCCPCGKSHMTPAPPIPLPPGMMAQLTAPVALSQMNQPPNPNQMQASFCSLMWFIHRNYNHYVFLLMIPSMESIFPLYSPNFCLTSCILLLY